MTSNDASIKVKGSMKNPSHTGELILREIIAPLGLSISDAADALGVSRPNLSKLLNGRASLSWDMAIKIEKAFGPKADHLMRMQFSYDRAQAAKRADDITVNRVVRQPQP